MNTFKKLGFFLTLKLFFFFFFFFTISATQHPADTQFCGNIKILEPFFSPNSTVPSLLNHMILCKSQKLHFRTSIGLFPISSIDYTTKTLIISPSGNYISLGALTAGLPQSPHPNSLILFNCTRTTNPIPPYIRNCTGLHQIEEQEVKMRTSCLIVEDIEKLEMGFHPKDLGCSDFKRVHRRSLSGKVEMGSRVSFDIDHVPEICKECEKPNGNCGAGLKCICHPKECKDKVVQGNGAANHGGSNFMFCLIVLSAVINFLMY